MARFHQTLAGIEPTPGNVAAKNTPDDSRNSPDSERRDPNASTPAVAANFGSMHQSFTVAELAANPMPAPDTLDATRLIEQATSILLERAPRSDECRLIVSLDHAITGGASAEFVRDGAFLYVRLLARNDASYRSMWTRRAELQERLAASTGLQTRVEILEVYGDGRSA